MKSFSKLDTTNYIIIIFTIFLGYFIIFNAWVAEDAFITFRTLDNFVHGYGLTWNVTERVQAFTHPLWLFVHIPFYYITGEAYLTTIVLSILFDLAAFLLIIHTFSSSVGFTFTFLLIPLLLSKAFAEYSTSGLENPLTFFCLSLFCYLLVKVKFSSVKLVFCIGLVANFAALNRLDTILFFIPTLIFLAFRYRSKKHWALLLLSFMPLILWEIFSLFYYGFLFPNTAYAKLSTGIAATDYLKQGIIYAIDLLKYDPFSALFLAFAVSITIYNFIKHGKFDYTILIGFGIILYCLYVLKVGGDFMSGRFWSSPFFLGVILIYWLFQQIDHQFNSFMIFLCGVIVIIGVKLLLVPIIVNPPPIAEMISDFGTGIAQERRVYEQHLGLLNLKRSSLHPWAKQGTDLRKQQSQMGENSALFIFPSAYIGILGYYSGQRIIIIDLLGLSDAMLARLPVIDNKIWRIGHFLRHVPFGYLEAQKTGHLSEMSPILAEYYAALRTIISEPLFDTHRIITLIRFKLGCYDHFLDSYINSVYPIEIQIEQGNKLTTLDKAMLYEKLANLYKREGYLEFYFKMHKTSQTLRGFGTKPYD